MLFIMSITLSLDSLSKVIPLGSRVYVEGYGEAIAADTGGLIKGHKIDLFMDTERECEEWGIQPRRIYILGRN